MDASLEKLLGSDNIQRLAKILGSSQDNETTPYSVAKNNDTFQRKIDMICAIIPFLTQSERKIAQKLIDILTIAKALKSIMEQEQ